MLTERKKLNTSRTRLGLIQFYKSMLSEDIRLINTIFYRRNDSPELLTIPIAQYGSKIIHLDYGETKDSWFLMVIDTNNKPPIAVPMGIGFTITTETIYYFRKYVLDSYEPGPGSVSYEYLIADIATGIRNVFPELHNKKKALFGIDESHSKVCVVSGEFDIYRFDVSIKNRVIGKSEWSIRVFEKKLNEITIVDDFSLIDKWCTSSIQNWLRIDLGTHVTEIVTNSFKL